MEQSLSTASDFPTPTAATPPDTSSSSLVSRVAIKTPPFYRGNPKFWFVQIEAQFHLASISQSSTKFFHILSALPEDIGCNISAAALTAADYDGLKAEVLSIFEKTRSERLEEALGTISLNGEKPSLAFRRIGRLLCDAGLSPDDELAKSKLLNCLPPHIRTVLAAHTSLPGTEFAKVADTLLAVGLAAPHGQADGFLQPVAASSERRFRPSASRDAAPATDHRLAPFSPGQRPLVCRHHIFFGARSRTCKPWCVWPDKPSSLTVLPNSRPVSPGPNRPSSPVAVPASENSNARSGM
jgi:hypothetical protein